MEPEISPAGEASKNGPELGYYLARIGAQFLDVMVCFGFYFLFGTAVAIKVGGITPDGFNVTGMGALVIMGATAVTAFGYFWLLEGIFGRTFGKMIFLLKVIREGGSHCGLASSAIRNLVRVVDAFPLYVPGLVAIFLTKQQQRLGDLAAKTRVVPSGGGWAIRIAGISLLVMTLVGTGYGVFHLRSRGPQAVLVIGGVQFTEGEGGPAVSKSYKPGEELFLRFPLQGVSVDKNGVADSRVEFIPVDPAGKPLLEAASLEIKNLTGLTGEAPGVVNVKFNLKLPQYAEGGKYRLKVKATDRLKSKEATAEIPILVEGPKITDREVFAIQDFTFRDKDGNPKPNADYSPGDTVYSTFNVKGFKLGEKNRLKLRLSMLVRGEDGQTLLDQANLIDLEDSFFYPPTYLPLNTTLNTPSTIAPGKYSMQLTLFDDVAGTQMSFAKEFSVHGASN